VSCCTLHKSCINNFIKKRVRITNAKGAQISRLSPPKEDDSAPEKVVIDPSKGGQVEAHESKGGSKALQVREGEWIWEGVRSVLEVDLFKYVPFSGEMVFSDKSISAQVGKYDTGQLWL